MTVERIFIVSIRTVNTFVLPHLYFTNLTLIAIMLHIKKNYLLLLVLFATSFISAQETLYEENFIGQNGKGVIANSGSLNTDLSGVDWTIDISNASLNSNNNGNNSDYFYVKNEAFAAKDTDGNAIWTSPSITITNFINVSFSLDAYTNGKLDYSDTFLTEYKIDNGNWTTATNGYLNNDFNTTINQTTGLTGGNTLQIRISIDNDNNNEKTTFDNIVVEGFQLCPSITDLTIDSTTLNTANISWTAGSSETNWEIAVQLAGTGTPAETGTPTTTNSFTDNTLNASTAYEVYVRADCDTGDFSNWTGPINFTTPIANDDLANATLISCGNIYSGDTTFATIDEVGAPDVSTIETNTSTDNDSPNVWFQFIGTGNPVTLSTCANTSFDTEIIVFTGTSGNLTNVAEGYDECSNSTYEAEVTFNSILGTVYSISVEGWNFYDIGTFELSVTCTTPEPTTYTFTNGSWDNNNNPDGIATINDDIIIASGDATISSNTTANTVTVSPGAGLIIETDVTLTTINGLTLESNSTSYSSLILDGTVTGTLTYKRHVNINGSGSTGSNDLISAPLTGQTFNTFASANPNILNNGTLYLFGPFDKTAADYLIYTSTETATLDAGVGYRAASSDNDTFTFTGTANSEPVSIDITNYGIHEAEWNLVGNPYPSYLNVQDFLLHQVSDGIPNIALFEAGTAAIYGYDGNAIDDWTIYNLANTTASTVIAPGQGFFVSANVANVPLYDLEFTPAMRSTGSGDDFIVGRNAELVYIKLNASTSNNSYHTDFYFNNNSSLGFDLGYDAKIWGDATPDFAIYSHLAQDNNGEAITLQSLPVSNLTDVSIPLGVNANQGEQLTFSIADMTLPASINVYLDDVVANTSTLLNNSDYIITPTTALSGTGRFFLRTSEDALSTIDNSFDALNIFALTTSKELVISGQLQKNSTLNLYDIQGRLVLSTKLDTTTLQNRINTSSLNGGIYIVNVSNTTQQKSQKVIIK